MGCLMLLPASLDTEGLLQRLIPATPEYSTTCLVLRKSDWQEEQKTSAYWHALPNSMSCPHVKLQVGRDIRMQTCANCSFCG